MTIVLATQHKREIRKKAGQDRLIELETALEEVKAEPKKAEITAVRTIYFTSATELCKFDTKSHKTNI